MSKEDLPFERLLSKLHLDEAPGLEMVISADCLLHQALSRDDVDFITSILSKDGLDISTIRFKVRATNLPKFTS